MCLSTIHWSDAFCQDKMCGKICLCDEFAYPRKQYYCFIILCVFLSLCVISYTGSFERMPLTDTRENKWKCQILLVATIHNEMYVWVDTSTQHTTHTQIHTHTKHAHTHTHTDMHKNAHTTYKHTHRHVHTHTQHRHTHPHLHTHTHTHTHTCIISTTWYFKLHKLIIQHSLHHNKICTRIFHLYKFILNDDE